MTRHDVPLSMMAGRYASFLSVEVNSSKSTLPYLNKSKSSEWLAGALTWGDDCKEEEGGGGGT
jgi:hypothetical protein